jgi:hypothetical protein
MASNPRDDAAARSKHADGAAKHLAFALQRATSQQQLTSATHATKHSSTSAQSPATSARQLSAQGNDTSSEERTQQSHGTGRSASVLHGGNSDHMPTVTLFSALFHRTRTSNSRTVQASAASMDERTLSNAQSMTARDIRILSQRALSQLERDGTDMNDLAATFHVAKARGNLRVKTREDSSMLRVEAGEGPKASRVEAGEGHDASLSACSLPSGASMFAAEHRGDSGSRNAPRSDVGARQTDNDGRQTDNDGRQTDNDGRQTDNDERQTDNDVRQTDNDGRQTDNDIVALDDHPITVAHSAEDDGSVLTMEARGALHAHGEDSNVPRDVSPKLDFDWNDNLDFRATWKSRLSAIREWEQSVGSTSGTNRKLNGSQSSLCTGSNSYLLTSQDGCTATWRDDSMSGEINGTSASSNLNHLASQHGTALALQRDTAQSQQANICKDDVEPAANAPQARDAEGNQHLVSANHGAAGQTDKDMSRVQKGRSGNVSSKMHETGDFPPEGRCDCSFSSVNAVVVGVLKSVSSVVCAKKDIGKADLVKEIEILSGLKHPNITT